MNRAVWLLCAAFIAPLLTAGCDDHPLTGPPELRLGRDECAECGMLLNEDRCSAALLVEMPTGSGRRRYLLYDDLGCLLDAELQHGAEFTVIERHVRDHAGRTWARAEDASFLRAPPDSLPTPMASGMVAFRDRGVAMSEAARVQGTLTDFQGLIGIRRERWDARHRESTTPQTAKED